MTVCLMSVASKVHTCFVVDVTIETRRQSRTSCYSKLLIENFIKQTLENSELFNLRLSLIIEILIFKRLYLIDN